MRMILAQPPLMERFLALLLQYPERFVRSEVPCGLQDLWELALEDAQQKVDSESPYNPLPVDATYRVLTSGHRYSLYTSH
jgi:hypothetical protein